MGSTFGFALVRLLYGRTWRPRSKTRSKQPALDSSVMLVAKARCRSCTISMLALVCACGPVAQELTACESEALAVLPGTCN
eukprot:scaffold1388_cov390-Prasinococcus_capsulatus_cf.AAC.13